MKLKFYEMLETAESWFGVIVTYDAECEAYRVEDLASVFSLGQLLGTDEYSGEDFLQFKTWVHNNYLYIQPV